VDLDTAVVEATTQRPSAPFVEQLGALGPWKKGPFHIQGIHLDSEWRGDLKWDRVRAIASPLLNHKVLDVGTGNGYFLYRAVGDGAELALGLEPSALFCAQFLALQRFFDCKQAALLPATCEAFARARSPKPWRTFDTVLSMGVLYHRRSPLDHLAELMSFAKSGGELVLETIVVDGPLGHSLVPEGRYAGMKNVWFLPTLPTLVSWLTRLELTDIRTSRPVRTTSAEQRTTKWSSRKSLAHALDPNDPSRTIEGHPAPQRAIVVAKVP
jgi:tRNA (mo5U34)-methyltransferase